MRFRRPISLSAAALIGLSIGACDKPAPPAADAPPAPKHDIVATTQQILAGPRKPVALGVMPFTVDVPAGWAVQNHGDPGSPSLSMLEGPMSGGDAHLILRARENQSAERMKTLIDRISRDGPAIEKAGGILSIRDLGEVRVVERRDISRSATISGTTAPATTLSDAIQRPIEWRITLFVPSGINYEQYEMQFIDLTPAGLLLNEKLLSEIVASLKYVDIGPPPL